MSRLFIILIDIYRNTLSHMMICTCRFHPSCSAYAKEAIKKRGCVKGVLLAIKRILKCNPLHPGGYDPVA